MKMKTRHTIVLLILIAAAWCLSGCGSLPVSSKGDSARERHDTLEAMAVPYRDGLFLDALRSAVEKGEPRVSLCIADGTDDLSGIVSKEMNLSNRVFEIGYFTEKIEGSITRETVLSDSFYLVDLDITYNDRIDRYADYGPGGKYRTGAYSAEALHAWVMDTVLAEEPSATVVFSGADEQDKTNVREDLSAIRIDNEYLAYYLTSLDYVMDPGFEDTLVITITPGYREDLQKNIYEVDATDDISVISMLIDTIDDWGEETVFHFPGSYDNKRFLTLAEIAFINDAEDCPCRADSFVSSAYEGKNGTIISLAGEFVPSAERRAQMQELLDEKITEAAADIDAIAGDADAAEEYRLIADYVCEVTDYDDGLADAIRNEDETEDMWFEMSALGALKDGYTVCSGYAGLFKILCDHRQLPCWIIAGSAVSPEGYLEGHAWNAVLLDGEMYYIDPTFIDHAGDAFFLFWDYEIDAREEDPDWIIPW